MSENSGKTKKRRAYGSYYWIDPQTKLGYCKVQIPTDDFYPNGKRKYKEIKKRAKNATHADQLADELFADYDVRKTGFVEGERMTFGDLAKWYIDNKVQPPEYSAEGVKVSGMRTHRNVRLRIERMQKIFGKTPIKNIDEDELAKIKRLLKKESPDALPASINRYLEDLRAMLKTAVRRRWLKENPFDFGDKLIDTALERRRDVVLSKAEENLLLATARASEKTKLYYVLLCLMDTGARPSEIYDASTEKAEPVKWTDFKEFEFDAVRLTSLKGRKKLVRFAPVSARLKTAMIDLFSSSDNNLPEAQIFEVKSLKRSWETAKREADYAMRISEKLNVSPIMLFDNSIDGEIVKAARKEVINEIKDQKKAGSYVENPIMKVRLRDLRRSFSTRLANLGIENDLRQRILGHEQAQTTFDYTSANLDTALKISKMFRAGDHQELDSSNN